MKATGKALILTLQVLLVLVRAVLHRELAQVYLAPAWKDKIERSWLPSVKLI